MSLLSRRPLLRAGSFVPEAKVLVGESRDRNRGNERDKNFGKDPRRIGRGRDKDSPKSCALKLGSLILDYFGLLSTENEFLFIECVYFPSDETR